MCFYFLLRANKHVHYWLLSLAKKINYGFLPAIHLVIRNTDTFDIYKIDVNRHTKKSLFTRLSQRGTTLVLSPRMCVLMTMAARNDDKVISAMFMQKYVPETRSTCFSQVIRNTTLPKARFPLLELTARVNGWPVSITRQHGPCWRAVNSGSGNRA